MSCTFPLVKDRPPSVCKEKLALVSCRGTNLGENKLKGSELSFPWIKVEEVSGRIGSFGFPNFPCMKTSFSPAVIFPENLGKYRCFCAI
ncbi:Uncharacterised protein [Chlamydia abortus]|nr:Uncharacterised protein [Chlamydia abortus]